MGKEALTSLCPPGFRIDFVFDHLVLRLSGFRFSLVNPCTHDDGMFLGG